MIGREIQLLEIVLVIFDLGAILDRKPHSLEDGDHLVKRLHQWMLMARLGEWHRAGGHRKIDRLTSAASAPRTQQRFLLLESLFYGLPECIQLFPRRGLLLFRNLA